MSLILPNRGRLSRPTGESDPNYDDLTLRLLMDGTDGSTTFTDDGPTGHTVTANGDAQIDTAQSKFGGASALFDGTGDYLSIPGSTDFAFGTGDFTIDFWVRPNGNLSNKSILGNRNTSGVETHWNFQIIYVTNNLQIYSSATAIFSDNDNLLTPNAWNHVAWTRSGTTGRLFIGGAVAEQATDTRNYSDSTTPLWIGRDGAEAISPVTYFNGWLDAVRIYKGFCKYTSAFTPPTTPYE